MRAHIITVPGHELIRNVLGSQPVLWLIKATQFSRLLPLKKIFAASRRPWRKEVVVVFHCLLKEEHESEEEDTLDLLLFIKIYQKQSALARASRNIY